MVSDTLWDVVRLRLLLLDQQDDKGCCNVSVTVLQWTLLLVWWWWWWTPCVYIHYYIVHFKVNHYRGITASLKYFYPWVLIHATLSLPILQEHENSNSFDYSYIHIATPEPCRLYSCPYQLIPVPARRQLWHGIRVELSHSFMVITIISQYGQQLWKNSFLVSGSHLTWWIYRQLSCSHKRIGWHCWLGIINRNLVI